MPTDVLFRPFTIRQLTIPNRIVMAPMTRSRADANAVINASALKYYGSRAGAGLIITEGINTSPLAELYKRILYLPAAISGAAIGVIWYAIFNNQLGILNAALRFVGLGDLAQAWLTTPPLNT